MTDDFDPEAVATQLRTLADKIEVGEYEVMQLSTTDPSETKSHIGSVELKFMDFEDWEVIAEGFGVSE